MKICSKCQKEKPETEFFLDRRRLGAFRAECKVCHNSWSKSYAHKNPERIRAAQRKHRYGMPPSEFNQLFTAQSGRCAICGSPSALDVDHCHRSGKIRGLLCRQCNQAIGLFRESTKLLESAKRYLNKFSTQASTIDNPKITYCNGSHQCRP